MRKPLQWLLPLTVAGAVLGGLFGLVIAVSSDCHIDSDGSLPAGACFRFFGMYLSDVTKYVSAGALAGAFLGVAAWLFSVVPMFHGQRGDPAPPVHPLEVPVIWFGLQLLELVVLIPALLFWIPDPGVWPEGLRIGIWVIALAGVTAMNYAIRRRFIPR